MPAASDSHDVPLIWDDTLRRVAVITEQGELVAVPRREEVITATGELADVDRRVAGETPRRG